MIVSVLVSYVTKRILCTVPEDISRKQLDNVSSDILNSLYKEIIRNNFRI